MLAAPASLWIALALTLVLATLHLAAPRLRRLPGVPESALGSFAGGISVAYVFVHLLPELAEGNEKIGEALEESVEATALLDLAIFAVALAGFSLFYGLEHLARRSRGREPGALFGLHLGAFAIYNALITYTLGRAHRFRLRATLAPREPFEVQRRYVEASNVLETTFRTAAGTVRVTDALTMDELGELPWRELARRIEGVSGRVELGWRVEPRFDWGRAEVSCERHGDAVIARGGRHLASIQAWEAGQAQIRDRGVEGIATVEEGSVSLLCLTLSEDQPLALPARDDVQPASR